MSKKRNPYRFIFAGGGTGGHLYPALAVAQQIREMKPEAEILFVGTKNKIEARVVPEHDFNFKTIWISGFARKFNMNNILFPVKIIVSVFQSLGTNFGFKPRVAIGSGAYVSGPVIWAASLIGAKVVLLEQNSYPGLTNRLLEKKA
ncbi:MAG: glycosyltransferase, partial [Ignavibacteria bacterium]|nr:glycosyltransferase [Ignavibacteria bacterium]